MASIASISIKFSADLKQFSRQMQTVNRQLNSVGKTLQNTGTLLTASVTLPLTGIAAASVKAYSELEGVATAFERLNQPDLLKDLQKATKGTVADLELMQAAVKADNFQIPLQELSTLLEFARRRAKDTGESVDYLVNSIVTGIGRKSPLILDNLGISAAALKDELGGAAAASSSIADVTEAVGTIARQELAKMGTDANTLSESFLQIKATVNNLFAEFGGIIAQFIQPLVGALKNVFEGFKALSPETKKFIVTLGGLAAAVGPLLVLAGTILPAIASGFALLTGPIGLIVAGLTAIGVIIVKNWAPIKGLLIDIANYFIDLYNESTLVRVAVEVLTNAFKNLFDIGSFVFTTLKSIVSDFIDNAVNGFSTFGALIKAVLTGDLESIPGILAEGIADSQKRIIVFGKTVKDEWAKLTKNIEQNSKDALDAIVERRKIEFLEEDVDATGIENAVATAVSNGVTTGTGGRAQLQALDLAGLQEGVVPTNPLEPIAAAMPEQVQTINQSLTEFEMRLIEFQDLAGGIVEGAAEQFAVGFGNIIGAIATGAAPAASIFGFLVQTIGDMLQQLGRAAIQIGITMKAIKLSFTNPFAAIAAGVAAIALGAIVKAFIPPQLQAFQDGGIVGGTSYYGDKILARVNSGELILNNEQQRALYNQLNNPATALAPVVLETRISGEDLVLIQQRATNSRNRTT